MNSALTWIPVWVVFVACAYGASDAKVTLRWVDEDGKPMSGLRIAAGFVGDHTGTGTTDTNGLCTFKGTTYSGEIEYSGRPEGYYYSQGEYKFPGGIKDGKWQPWNPVVTTVVRKIINPIPMYAKRVETHIPRINERFGYDVMVGDWVQPAGKGSISDLVFHIEGFWRDYRDNASTLTVSFSNPQDGIITLPTPEGFQMNQGSAYIMPREAPLTGYTNTLKWRRSRKPSDDMRSDAIIDEVGVEGRNHLYRVRCVTNEAGVVTNALYGKFRGNIEFVGASDGGEASWLRFTYYLNPTPNDRNMEFDPQKNLLKDLKSTEQVMQP